MSSLEQRSAEAVASPTRFAQAVNGLRAGQGLTWLCADDPAVRSALVQSVIDAVADLDTRFVRAGNPLRAPLTIERLLIQAIGPEADLRNSRDPATVTRLLGARQGDESRVVVVLEQAETLDDESLEMLEAMEPHLESAEPRVQFLLSAPHRPEVRPREIEAELAPLVEAEELARPEPPRRSLRLLLAGSFVLLGSVGLAVYLFDPGLIADAGLYWPERLRVSAAEPQSLIRAAVTPPQAQAAVPSPLPPAAAQPSAVIPTTATPAAVDSAAMRNEFNEFLARAGDSTARLTDQQKSELFEQFLAWRQAQGSVPR